jgi:small subunit ribosomal protein S20
MANIKSAKKRIRVIEAKTQRNKRVKAHLKAVLKAFEAAVAEGDKQAARDQLALAEKKLKQAAAKGTVHKNSASRKVSRLTQKFTAAFGKEALLDKANKPAIPDPEEKKARAAAKLAAEEAKEAAKKAKKAEAAAEKARKAAKKSTKVESAEEAAPAEEAVEEAAPAEEAAAEEAAPAEEAAEEPAPAEEAAEEAAPAEEAAEEPAPAE